MRKKTSFTMLLSSLHFEGCFFRKKEMQAPEIIFNDYAK